MTSRALARAIMTIQRTRIVLIYADTGGGHRSTAQAVAAGLDRLYGDRVSVSLVNATAYMPYPFNQAERVYPIAIARYRRGYHLYWHLTNNTAFAQAASAAMRVSGRRLIQDFFARHPADVYVSCHPLVNQLLPRETKRLRPEARFVAVVSDMVTVHGLFWSRHIDHTTVPTEAARALAIRHGLSPDRVSVTGQPVLPDFAVRASAGRNMRRALGLEPEATTVLMMGGGDGMGRMSETAQAIAHSGLPLQLVVICGRNERARIELSQLASATPVHAIGFTDRVPEHMGAADMLVSKAGPGAICEAFVAGLPTVLYDAVPGQESGNVDLMVSSGAGVWRPQPAAVVDQLREWVCQPVERERAALAARAQARPDAALAVAQLIDDITNARHTRPASHAPNITQAQAGRASAWG